jgi:hypothetical protein
VWLPVCLLCAAVPPPRDRSSYQGACPSPLRTCLRLQSPKVTEDRVFNGFGTNFEGSPEPIYGNQFLPRKFKIAVTGELGAPGFCGWYLRESALG